MSRLLLLVRDSTPAPPGGAAPSLGEAHAGAAMLIAITARPLSSSFASLSPANKPSPAWRPAGKRQYQDLVSGTTDPDPSRLPAPH